MKRYLYIAGAILVAIILIESLRLISIRMSEDNKLRKFIEKNRTILILLASIILSVILFDIFDFWAQGGQGPTLLPQALWGQIYTKKNAWDHWLQLASPPPRAPRDRFKIEKNY